MSKPSKSLGLAADAGHSRAQANLGSFYFEGWGGLPKDPAPKPARLLQLAVRSGDARAGRPISRYATADGLGGLAADLKAAPRISSVLLADQGDVLAWSSLAAFYQHGRGGVPKDVARQPQGSIRLAAQGGDSNAQKHLKSLGMSW